MPTPLFAPPVPLRRPPPLPPRTARRPITSCIPSTSRASDPAPVSTNLPVTQPSQKPSLARQDTLPSLFKGPEAVLGIVIAAAALLADFARNLTLLATRSRALPPPPDLFTIDRSIAALQTSLDLNQATLSDTERLLDEYLARANTAEQALAGIGTTRDSIQTALDKAVEADTQLSRIQSLLQQEAARRQERETDLANQSDQADALEESLKARQADVLKLRALVDTVRDSAQDALRVYKEKEELLNEQIRNTDGQLDELKLERERLVTQTSEMETRAASMSEQVSAANLALHETRAALEVAEADLEEKRAANAALDQQSARFVQRSLEADELRGRVQQMERELGELQSELRARDSVVNDVAAESDHLRSLLASREAELREIVNRMESAVADRDRSGGDSRKSESSLEEIKTNLEAEKLAFSAEISKAELASFDIKEEDLDPLERLGKEMSAEESLLVSGLRKAESTVKVGELAEERKTEAVQDIFESLGIEGDEEVSDGTFPPPDWDDVVAKEKNMNVEVGHVVNLQQAPKASENEGAKPVKRRGRPPKNKTGEVRSADAGSTPKRKRGRPRKNADA